METNYVTRDNFGMYAHSDSGPGPALMGADTMLGNDVYNKDGEDLGDIKEFMIDMTSGKVAYAVLSFGGLLGVLTYIYVERILGFEPRHLVWKTNVLNR